tara:strand:+ start:15525 stop:15854 length:330 start_codon:yes stop_codon:yes gene_type:complete
MPKKPRCPNGSRRKPRKTGKCVKNTKKKKLSTTQKSFLKGIKSKSKSKSKSKTLTLPSSKSKSKSKSKTKKKGNYRSFLKCEMKRLKKANPNVRQASIMKMAAKNWNKA